MNFDELFANVYDALRRERRISYRALRRRFELSDDNLEDLTDELVHAKKWTVDEERRVLVWIGDTWDVPGPTSQPQPTAPLDTQVQPTQIEPRSAATRAPEAERRQLTVMFCDLADSTRLSQQLDPEDLREIIRAYQDTAVSVIQQYDGYIAQYLGDGLLIYFGWPRAHENDAERAVYSGLGIPEAMQQQNKRLHADHGVQLAVRIGIHTGPVVVGEMGVGGRLENFALGETPNVAARLEGFATPNTVVISSVTAAANAADVCPERTRPP